MESITSARRPSDIWRALNIQNLDFTGVEASLRAGAAAGGDAGPALHAACGAAGHGAGGIHEVHLQLSDALGGGGVGGRHAEHGVAYRGWG